MGTRFKPIYSNYTVMNIAVCLNQVPDTSARVKIASDERGIESAGISYVINPYDEFALEVALQLKDKDPNIVITLFSVGDDSFQQNIRKAFAMGADNAVLLTNKVADAYGVAAVLAAAIKEYYNGLPDMVLLGKESTDFNSSQVGSMLGELLALPTVNVVVGLELNGKAVRLEREIEGGKEIIESELPLVITAQKGLNMPRVPNMKGIMAAKKKEILTKSVAVQESAKAELIKLEKPPQKQPGKLVGTAPELVALLHSEAKVV
ncbi:MAG: electron transfer flavoprotein subunit beta/FixA family protein [Chlorobiales bacterium]|nr:electron transfer flavoprotein subunit beta/FixA family protein [Chlorobiales bacterium]